MITAFTPYQSFAGGLLIGSGVVLLMLSLGRIAGISGIVGAVVAGNGASEGGWRLAFLAGMILSPLVFLGLTGGVPAIAVPPTMTMLVAGGILVGIGVYFGSGCTSGHGVCGIARLSPRSLAATATFMAFAAVTVFVVRHVVGG